MYLRKVLSILLIFSLFHNNAFITAVPLEMDKVIQNNINIRTNKTTLKVALFPYIPDSGGDQYKGLLQYITNEFQKLYPDILLQLRSIDTNDDFYDLDLLTKWLMSDGSGYDIVEVDTVLLGDLVNSGLVFPQFIDTTIRNDWHDAANMAVRVNNAVYAFPHLMCSYFLFTRDDQVAGTTTIDELSKVLGNIPTENYRLVGNLDSSWNLPALWINSYQDSDTSLSDVTAYALHAYSFTNSSFENILKLANLCNRTRNENHCLDGTFRKNVDMPWILFVQNRTTTMFGYSERLYFLLRNGSLEDYRNIKMIPLPLGNVHNHALFFTDAFVFRRNMSIEVMNASRLFAEFMGTPHMQAVFVGSGDKPDNIPRYLLPISKSAYDDPLLLNDRFYQQNFRPLTGFPFPTVGFRNTRKQLQTTILNYISNVQNSGNSSKSGAKSLYQGFSSNFIVQMFKMLFAVFLL